MSTNTIAVLVNGALVNIKSDKSFEDQNEWHYNKVETTTDSWVINSKGVKEYYTITPDVVGLTEWSTTEHSPLLLVGHLTDCLWRTSMVTVILMTTLVL